MIATYLSRLAVKSLALVILTGSLDACMMFIRPPRDARSHERTQASATQLYRASFSPTEAIRVGRLHGGKIQVPSNDGVQVTDAKIDVAERAPYMHAGQAATLGEVIAHYSDTPKAPFGRSELKRLRLSAEERAQLEAFLRKYARTSLSRRMEMASLSATGGRGGSR